MSNPRYPEEFKIQAVNQVAEKKLPVAEVAPRLGVSTHRLSPAVRLVGLSPTQFAYLLRTHQR